MCKQAEGDYPLLKDVRLLCGFEMSRIDDSGLLKCDLIVSISFTVEPHSSVYALSVTSTVTTEFILDSRSVSVVKKLPCSP